MNFRFLVLLAAVAGLGRSGAFGQDSPAATPQSPGQVVAQPEVPRAAPKSFWTRKTLTDGWWDIRSELTRQGITIAPVYEAEVAASAGAGPGRDAVISDGLINLTLDFDLDRLTKHLLPGARFHFNFLDVYGTSLSSKYLEDLGNTSNLAGPNGIRLQEIWLQQDLGTRNASLRAGMMGTDAEFFLASAAGIFLNGAFGPPPLLTANFNAAPSYPFTAPGIRLDVAPEPSLDFKLAVFAPNVNSLNYHHGTDFAIDRRDGALFLFELAYLLNQDKNTHGLAGTYKIGGMAQRGDYANWSSQAANALDLETTLHHGTNWALYAVADQELFKSDPCKIEAFARGGFASAMYSLVTSYLDAGLNFTGFVPGRQKDALGIGVIRSGIGNHASVAREVMEDDAPATAETVLEIAYNAVLTPWWNIQPDFQYLVNPEGSGHDALVFMFRSTVTF